jgi:hypothetical protein
MSAWRIMKASPSRLTALKNCLVLFACSTRFTDVAMDIFAPATAPALGKVCCILLLLSISIPSSDL